MCGEKLDYYLEIRTLRHLQHGQNTNDLVDETNTGMVCTNVDTN